MITFARATKPWLIAIFFVAFSLMLATGANANSPDFAIAGGWFFTQGGGDTARSDDGFAVIDDEGAKFWTAFQASGGVGAVGYPISDRFQWDGFVTQVMQKAVFQWRPDIDSVAFVNVFDDLSRHGFDDQLATLLVPEPEAFNDETGLSFGQIIAKRTALLEAEPALLAVYQAAADPLRNYGLPQSSVRQYDGLRAIRSATGCIANLDQRLPLGQSGNRNDCQRRGPGKAAGPIPGNRVRVRAHFAAGLRTGNSGTDRANNCAGSIGRNRG